MNVIVGIGMIAANSIGLHRHQWNWHWLLLDLLTFLPLTWNTYNASPSGRARMKRLRAPLHVVPQLEDQA